MLHRSKVAWAVTARDYGRTCTLGELLDLSVRLPGGGTLRDVVRPEWFEAAEHEPAPAARISHGRRRAAEPDNITQVTVKEQDNG